MPSYPPTTVRVDSTVTNSQRGQTNGRSMTAARSVAAHEPIVGSVFGEKDVQRQLLNSTTPSGVPLFADPSAAPKRAAQPTLAPPSPPRAANGLSPAPPFYARWIHVAPSQASCTTGHTADVAALMAKLRNHTGSVVVAYSHVGNDGTAGYPCATEAGTDFLWIDLHGVPSSVTDIPTRAPDEKLKSSPTQDGALEMSSCVWSDCHERVCEEPHTSSPSLPQQSTPLRAVWESLGLEAANVAELEAVALTRLRGAPAYPADTAHATRIPQCTSDGEWEKEKAPPSIDSTPSAPPLGDRVDPSTLGPEDSATGCAQALEESDVAAEHAPDYTALALADLYCECLEDLSAVDVALVKKRTSSTQRQCDSEHHSVPAALRHTHYAVVQLAALLDSVSPSVAHDLTAMPDNAAAARVLFRDGLCAPVSAASTAHVERRRHPGCPPQRATSTGRRNVQPIVGLYVLCFPNLCVTWCPSSTLSLAGAAARTTATTTTTHVVQGWETLQQVVFARVAHRTLSTARTTEPPICTATFLSALLTTVCSAYLPDTAAILSEVDAIDAMMPLIRPEEESDQADALRRVLLLRRKLSVHRRLLYQKVRLLESMQRAEVAVFTPFVLRGTSACSTRAVTSTSPAHTWAVSALSDQLAPSTTDTTVHRLLYETVRGALQKLDAARQILSHTTIIYTSSVTVRNATGSTFTDYYQLKIGLILLTVLPMNLVATQWGLNCLVPWQKNVVTDSLAPFWGIVGVMAGFIFLPLAFPMWMFYKGQPERVATP